MDRCVYVSLLSYPNAHDVKIRRAIICLLTVCQELDADKICIQLEKVPFPCVKQICISALRNCCFIEDLHDLMQMFMNSFCAASEARRQSFLST